MIPTLRQLQFLKALSDHGGFAMAAKAMHVTQPALSAGIAEMERLLGAKLVERGRGPLRFTALGEDILERASDILARTSDIVRLAEASQMPLSGRFRLGLIPTIAPFVLPQAVARLRDVYPEAKLFLREDQTARLIEALSAGSLDAAIIALPYDVSDLDQIVIGTDEIQVVLTDQHALCAQSRLVPSDLSPDELILMEDGHCLREHALGACQVFGKGAGLHSAQIGAGFAASSLTTLVQMVGSGLGIGFLPAMAVESGLITGLPITARRLISPQSARTIAMVWRKGSGRASDARLVSACFIRREAQTLGLET